MPVVTRAAIDPAHEDALRPHLERGESLVWTGVPRPSFFGGGCFLLAFGLFFSGFATLWTLAAVFAGGGAQGYFMAPFGLLFVGIGLYVMSMPLRAMRNGMGLVYGVTDRRAIIVRTGKAPLVRSWGPGQLAAVSIEGSGDKRDVYFAVDAQASSFMPTANATTAAGIGKVGFIGIEDFGAAQAALEAVAVLSAPEGPQVRREAAEGQPPAFLESKGGLEAFRVKLANVLAERRKDVERRKTRAQNLYWMVFAPALVLPSVYGLITGGLAGVIVGVFFTMFVAVAAFIASMIKQAYFDKQVADVGRAEALTALLDGWRADVHPTSKLFAWTDLGDASAVPPYRFANSAASGALKTYHRHRWARFAFATACGSPLVVELVDKVKYKAGSEIERHPLVRGRFLPNPAVWDVAALPESFRAGPLTVRKLVVAGRVALVFRGDGADAKGAAQAIRQLYERLGR